MSFVKVFWCSVMLFYLELVGGDYANSTISTVKMISDDFRIFQETGKRVSGRDGRKLISFDTKNNQIEVHTHEFSEFIWNKQNVGKV